MLFLKQFIWILFGLSLIALGACQTLEPQNHPHPGLAQHYDASAQQYLNMAEEATPPQKQALILQAAGRYLQEHNQESAAQLLSTLDNESLPTDLNHEKSLLLTHLALQQGRVDLAALTLENIQEIAALNTNQQVAYYHLLASIEKQQGHALLSAEAKMSLDPLLQNFSQRQTNRQAIWHDLNQLSLRDLASQVHSLPYGQLQGWLEISYAFKQYGDDSTLLDHEIKLWQQRYPQHPANTLLPNYHQPSFQPQHPANHRHSPPVITPNHFQNGIHVALLLPKSGTLAESGEAIRQGFMASYFADQESPPSA